MRGPTPLLYLSLVERERPWLSPLACPLSVVCANFGAAGIVSSWTNRLPLERFCANRRAVAKRQSVSLSAVGDLSDLFVIIWLISARPNGLGNGFGQGRHQPDGGNGA